MAELNTINYTNVNQGTRVVDRSGEARALAGGLSVAKKVIDEGVKAKVTGDMQDAINEVMQDSTTQPPMDALELTPGSREAYLSNRLDRLTAVIEQGKTSQRTLAEMQVKQVLSEAQTKFPWLFEELQARAGAILSGSAQMEQLGLDDAARKQAATAAGKEYQDIVDHARTSWEDGGLGIPPEIDPKSPYFQRLYNDLQHLRNQAEEQTRLTGMAIVNATADMTNRDAYLTIMDSMEGRYSLINSRYEKIKQKHGFYRVMEEVAKGDAGDLDFLEEWKAINARAMKDDILVERAAIQTLWREKISAIQEGTELGKLLKQRYEDVIAEFDIMLSAVDDMQDNLPSATQQIETAMAIRANVEYKKLPERAQAQQAYFTSGPGKFMLEIAAETKNPAGINLINRYGLSQQTYLAGLYPELFGTGPGHVGMQRAAVFNSTGALQIAPGASAAEIQATIDDRMKDPQSTWVVPTRNNEEQQIAALQNAEMHFAIWDRAQAVLPMASPEYADNTLLGLTYSLSYMNSDQRKPANVHGEILDMLSDGSLANAVDVSLSGTDTGKRQAFAAEALEFYQNTKPQQRRQEMANFYKDHLIGDQPLSSLVAVSVADLDKGRFSYQMNEDAVSKAAQMLAARSPGFMSDTTRARAKVEAEVTQAMAKIETEMQRQIAIERLLNKARANNIATIQQEDEWTAFFLGAGDSMAAETGAWADIFNYTKGTVTRSR